MKSGTFTRTYLLATRGATIQTDAQTSENKNIRELHIKDSDVFAALPPSLWDQNVTPIRNSNRDRLGIPILDREASLYSYTSVPSNSYLTAATISLERAGLAEIRKLLSHPQSGAGAVNSWVAPFFASFSMLPRKPERTRFGRFAPALALAAGPRRDFSSDKHTS